MMRLLRQNMDPGRERDSGERIRILRCHVSRPARRRASPNCGERMLGIRKPGQAEATRWNCPARAATRGPRIGKDGP